MLARFPRLRLAQLPTPLEPLRRVGEAVGHRALWIKRDDLTGLATGGNKTRKLEFLLGEALSRGCDVILTEGAVQSNHCRQTAAACARLGLECALVVNGDEPEVYQGNLLLDRLFGARIHFVGAVDAAARHRALEELAERLRRAGRRPAVIPTGGSTPVGALGYLDATLELVRQADEAGLEVRHVVVCASSCGTAAGVVAAACLLGGPCRVHLISVELPAAEVARLTVELAGGVFERLGTRPAAAPEEVMEVHDAYVGPGYGVPTPEGQRAVAMFGRLEGIVLDPVYTGKTAAGLLDLVARGALPPDEPAVFIHTGGTASVFAWPDAMLREEGHAAAGRGAPREGEA